MAVGTHHPAAEKDGDRHTPLLKQRLELKVAAVPVIDGDDERLWRELLGTLTCPGLYIVSQGYDIVTRPQRVELGFGTICAGRVKHQDRYLAPLENLPQQKGDA